MQVAFLAREGEMDGGIGGRKMSVRITVWFSLRRCSARSWPTKPPAPVMRIFMLDGDGDAVLSDRVCSWVLVVRSGLELERDSF